MPSRSLCLLGRHTQINRNTQTSFCQYKSIAFERSSIAILEKIMGTLNTKVWQVDAEFILPSVVVELNTEQVPSHTQMKTRPRSKVSMKCWPQDHILTKPKE